MSNDFYNASGNPAQDSAKSSATMRAEFTSIEEAMDKLPELTGNGNKLVYINAGGTAIVSGSASEIRTLLELVYGTDVFATGGVTGGQIAHGGDATGDDLTLRGTAHGDNNGVVSLNDLGGNIVTGKPASSASNGVKHYFADGYKFYLANSTPGNGDGDRATEIWFDGTRGDSIEVNMAKLIVEHDGTAQDYKGRMIFKVSQGGSPVEMLQLDSAGDIDATGDLDVSGALSKGSGTFKIDHPLDPENKFLVYGFTESPRYDLIHRGTVRLKSGKATVSIDAEYGFTPGTFEALVQNAAVTSLCPVNSFEKIKATKISRDSFTIESEDKNSTSEVNWVVTAERNDPFIIFTSETDENGHLINEPEKANPTGKELEAVTVESTSDQEDSEETVLVKNTKGFLRHPKAYGQEMPKRAVKYVKVKKHGK